MATVSLPQSIGRYRLLAPLGQGAMGVVHRAHDPQLERDVAIKLISVALAAGHGDAAETASRFAREARVAARIQHPNVVAVYDAGDAGDQLFLVMELVEGEALSQRFSRGDFPEVAAALEIAAEVADALAAAHLAGVVHRDVKPGNILLTRRGQVKVSDFGVARAVGETTELTRTGMMVGSPAYMAPEQVQGRPLDGRCDLFSLGVVLYEMLLHRKPFPADTLTTLVYQILHEDPFESEAVTARLAPEVAELLKWSLAKDPEHRVPDAATFAARARALARDSAASAKPTARLLIPPPAGSLPSGAPLPPPSYSTSAPTRQMTRARIRRWLPFAVAGALSAVLAAALLLKSPAPPPDRAAAASGSSGAGDAQPLRVEPPALVADVPEKNAPAMPPGKVADPARQARRENAAPAPMEIAAVATPSALGAVAAVPTPEPAVPAMDAPPVSATFEGRTGAEFHVEPEETEVTIDGRAIGPADDWDGSGGGKTYTFAGPGDYLVKLSLAGHRTEWVRVRISPNARRDIADVDTELEELD